MRVQWRLFGRHDAMLFAGLTIALLIVFSQPLQYLLDVARMVERTYNVALIPALVILTVVFIFHQQTKRQETLAAAAAAAAEAREAQARARELEHLVRFGHGLSRALDLDTLREVIWAHLPGMLDGRAAWILVRLGQQWQPLIGTSGKHLVDLETVATWMVTESAGEHGIVSGMDCGIYHCVPLLVGDSICGVLGIDRSGKPLGENDVHVLRAIAPVIAIAVKNAQLFAEIQNNSMHDALTGCFNRAHAVDVLQAELRRARRSRQPLSVILFDLDHFKRVNDERGHLCGDAVLAAVGSRLRELTRGSDVKARYGGEEFLVILPDTPASGAAHVADWLRQEIGTHPVAWKDSNVPVTASFGVADALPGETDPGALIGRADAALYDAKAGGRNCVRTSTPQREAAAV